MVSRLAVSRFGIWGLSVAAVALAALFVSSCGTSSGRLRDSATVVQLDHANFKIMRKNITATESVGHLFCAIPISSKPAATMMRKLHAQAKLGENETFVNVTEDYDIRAFWILWCTVDYTVSADVVRFGS